jgi:multidrug efflux pump subunit AcrB
LLSLRLLLNSAQESRTVWIVRLALRRPFTVAVLCLIIALMGVLSIQRMRVDVLPAIDIPVVIVVWNYPGLTAEEVEKRIMFLSERAYSTTVNGISRIESQAIPGNAIIKIYFEDGTDMGEALAQITSVSNSATRAMPPGTQPPAVLRFNASNVPVAQLTVSGERVSEQALFDLGLNSLRLRLFTIPGLATPAPYGGAQRQIMVDIDPARLAAKGLSPQDVVNAVAQSNITLPAGTARMGLTEYDIQLNASPERVPDFNSFPVKVVNGVPVLLGDVANVRDGSAVQSNIVRVNGHRATYLVILKKADASTLAVVDAARDLVPSLQSLSPPGVVIKLEFDQSVFVRAAVMGVLREALIAAGLVSLLILFFLGSWRSTVLVGISIPLSILVGIVGLFLTKQTLNLMTLGGLALAVGMLVDDATVEVENIHRNRLLGKPLTVAILDGAHQIAVPALAATLTICIVFFPVVLLQGPSRFLFIPLALSVVFSMMASYFLSRTLVPTLARKLMEKETLHHGAPAGSAEDAAHSGSLWGRFNQWRDRGFERFQERYERALTLLLAHPGITLLGAGALMACALALLPSTGLDFFPRVDTGQMRLHFRGPTGIRIEETERYVQGVEEAIRRIIPPDELSTINDNIGLPLFYNLGFVSTDNTGGSDADILIELREGHRPTEHYMARIRSSLPDQFPGCVFYFQAADVVTQVLNFGLPAPVDIQIEGRDVYASHTLARRLLDRVQRVPGVVDARIPQVFNKPAVRVNVDRQRAALVGLTERDVANNLLTSLSSSVLVSPNFWISPVNSVNYTVAVQTPISELTSLSDLLATPITTGVGTAPGLAGSVNAPYLGALSDVQPTQTRASTNHYTVQNIIEVRADVEGRDLGAVSRDLQKVIDELQKDAPPNTRLQLRGQTQSMYSSFRGMGLGLILAIVLVYLLMVVLFQSWMDPFIIVVAVPGALVGILWMLMLTGTTLNVSSFMGAIMAVGIAVSNSILLVSFANDVRVEQHMDAVNAARLAGKTRLRPVLMTALAMILGMLPMALGLGEGGEQNAPLGRSVIGGLIVATFVTLFVVPVVYSKLRRAEPTKHLLDQQFARETAGAPSAAEG